MIVVALRRQYKIQAKSSEMVVNCRLRVADVLSESLSSERLKDNRSVEGLSLEYSTFSLVILWRGLQRIQSVSQSKFYTPMRVYECCDIGTTEIGR